MVIQQTLWIELNIRKDSKYWRIRKVIWKKWKIEWNKREYIYTYILCRTAKRNSRGFVLILIDETAAVLSDLDFIASIWKKLSSIRSLQLPTLPTPQGDGSIIHPAVPSIPLKWNLLRPRCSHCKSNWVKWSRVFLQNLSLFLSR